MAPHSITLGLFSGNGSSPPPRPELVALLDEFDKMGEDESRTKHVYACFGLASYWCQTYQEGLANLLLVHARITGRAMTIAEFDKLDEKTARKTLGQLVQDLRAVVDFDQVADAVLGNALSLRNRLTHSFFREHAASFLNVSGKRQMVVELTDAIGLFKYADSAVEMLIAVLCKTAGINLDKLLESAAAEMESDLHN